MPESVILDLDSTLLDAYGRQEGRAFNFYYQSNGNVKVYVYDKEHNAQLKEWEKILSTTNCKISDSGEFVI